MTPAAFRRAIIPATAGIGLAAFTGLALFLSPVLALAGENPLLGTWKLKSWVSEVPATGARYNPAGEHPNGYLSYSADGRMYGIIVWENRVKPLATTPTDAERVKLYQTMATYAGTYTVLGEKVTHHLDISWNQAWTGTDQLRFFKLDGNTLTITTPVLKNPNDGREVRGVLIWEKVKARAQ